jgi:LDH2 family malate/lactate/ureidoglycolate dehydrogenase
VLSLAIAAFGALAGGDAIPTKFGNWGYQFIFVRPDVFLPAGEFERRMDQIVAEVLDAAPDGRIPGQRSGKLRDQALAGGLIEIPEDVLTTLRTLTN